ncbi:MAG: toxic anion resistance protein [Proteobacteria bacterium]|nr:toxic anion resistance protein [Pseudomonadota bacterium]
MAAPLVVRADPGKVAQIQRTIEIKDTAQITSFGERAQRDVAGFADRILEQTRNREIGDTGELLSDVIAKARGLDPADLQKGGLFSRGVGAMRRRVHRFRSKFETVAAQIDRVTVELEKRTDRLRRDVTMLDGLHDQTRQSIKELDAFIEAGKQYAAEFKATELPRLQQAATVSGDGTEDLMAAQNYQDAVQALDRLEKRVLYLQQARQIAIQQLPQIRIVQNGDTTLIESLQASINLTIPAWKQKMVLLLGLQRQSEALALQRAVTDATNEMLRQSSEMMKTQALAIEEQSQKGIVDIETLAKTNQDLIDTIEGVLSVQAEGRRKRVQVEAEMERQTEALRITLARAPTALT